MYFLCFSFTVDGSTKEKGVRSIDILDIDPVFPVLGEVMEVEDKVRWTEPAHTE